MEKYDAIKMKKNEMKALMGFEPALWKINRFSAASESAFSAIQADSKQFSKLHMTAEYASLMF